MARLISRSTNNEECPFWPLFLWSCHWRPGALLSGQNTSQNRRGRARQGGRQKHSPCLYLSVCLNSHWVLHKCPQQGADVQKETLWCPASKIFTLELSETEAEDYNLPTCFSLIVWFRLSAFSLHSCNGDYSFVSHYAYCGVFVHWMEL